MRRGRRARAACAGGVHGRRARAGGRFDGVVGRLPLHFDPGTLRYRDLAPDELAVLDAAAAAAADSRGALPGRGR